MLKFWDFNSGKCVETLNFNSPIAHILFKGENDLLALAGDDLCIRIVDVDTKKIVREFYGHEGRITDMTFSPDGRWLVSSSFDSSIRTWDIVSGFAIDAFVVDQIATSLTFSPKADVIVSTHANSVGLNIWANKLQFSNVALRKLPDDFELSTLELPSIGGLSYNSDQAVVEADEISTFYSSPDQLAVGMLTLSLEPRSKWHNLIHLETIRVLLIWLTFFNYFLETEQTYGTSKST
jgi:U3 small nucleolar RNA-associated protein 21